MEPLLEGVGVGKWFGGLRVLSEVDFRLSRGEILGLIGPNGAGKTTLVNIISGTVHGWSGVLRFEGTSLRGLPAHRIARLGITRTFQVSRAFLGMTVEDNVMVGALFGSARAARARKDARRTTQEVLDFLGLGRRGSVLVRTLNVPDRKLVDLGRALAMNPDVLLLDELMAGLNPADMADVMRPLRALSRQGVSLVIIEHVMKAIVELCHRVMVLHHGEKIADAPTGEVMHDRHVIEAYLGSRYRALTAPGADAPR